MYSPCSWWAEVASRSAHYTEEEWDTMCRQVEFPVVLADVDAPLLDDHDEGVEGGEDHVDGLRLDELVEEEGEHGAERVWRVVLRDLHVQVVHHVRAREAKIAQGQVEHQSVADRLLHDTAALQEIDDHPRADADGDYLADEGGDVDQVESVAGKTEHSQMYNTVIRHRSRHLWIPDVINHLDRSINLLQFGQSTILQTRDRNL